MLEGAFFVLFEGERRGGAAWMGAGQLFEGGRNGGRGAIGGKITLCFYVAQRSFIENKKRMIDNDKSRADGPSQLLTAQQHRVKLAHPMLFFLLRLYAA